MYSPFLLIVFQCQYASCPLQKVRPDVHTDQILSENKYLCLPFCIAYFDNFSLYQNILKYNINNQQVNLIPQGLGVSFVCRRYHIFKSSLMRWHKKFDGTRESLLEKSHRSHSKHLNAHTDEELKWIRNYHDAILRSLSMISMVNFGLLKDTPAILVLYTGSYPRLGYSSHAPSTKKKHRPQPYDTPAGLSIKWQMGSNGLLFWNAPSEILPNIQ